MDPQRLQVGIRLLLILDIRRVPRQGLRFTPLLQIRWLVIHKLGIHKLGIHKLGIHKLGNHKLGIRWLVTHRQGTHRLGTLVTLDILDTPGILLMAMLLGMPSKGLCSP